MKAVSFLTALWLGLGWVTTGLAAGLAERAAEGIERHRKGDGLLVFRWPDGRQLAAGHAKPLGLRRPGAAYLP